MSEPIHFKTLSLEELLELYKGSSPEAFNEFFNRTKKLVYNYLRKRLGNASDADDVFQETYLRVHKYVYTYNPEKKAIVWLMFIARHAMIDRCNARKKEMANSEMVDRLVAKDATDEQSMFSSLVNHLFKDLSSEEVSLISSRIFNEDSYEDIAREYGISEVNARQKISRVLKRFREGWSS